MKLTRQKRQAKNLLQPTAQEIARRYINLCVKHGFSRFEGLRHLEELEFGLHSGYRAGERQGGLRHWFDSITNGDWSSHAPIEKPLTPYEIMLSQTKAA